MPRQLRGYFPIMPTAFDEQGQVDLESMRRLVNFLVDNGAHGMSPNGGDSEGPELSMDEQKRIAAAVVEESAGRLPVLVGCSFRPSTAEIVELAQNAERVGANAIFVRPPGQREDMTDDEMFAHYAAVSEAIDIPVMIHASGNMTPSFIERLLDKLRNVKYIKEETDHGPKITAYVQALGDRVTVFGPGLNLTIELARGALGYMPSCCAPRIYASVFDLWQAGDRQGARRQWHRLLPLVFWRWHTSSQEAGKEYLKHHGIFRTSYVRATKGQHMLDDYHLQEMLDILATIDDPTAPA